MIRLTALSARGYRSLKSIRLDVGQVGLFVGENGVGKSNLYRALQLVRAAANGSLAREIAAEGGMQSAMWSGVRRLHEPGGSFCVSSWKTMTAVRPMPTM